MGAELKRLPVVRPKTRGECGETRPCPFVSCRYHLLLDVGEDGRLWTTRDIEEENANSIAQALDEMPETCALDVASRGGIGATKIGEILGMTRTAVEDFIKETAENIPRRGLERHEHPEDFYIRYSDMGADELAEITAELRARNKGTGRK